jgi:hypothetical protein
VLHRAGCGSSAAPYFKNPEPALPN